MAQPFFFNMYETAWLKSVRKGTSDEPNQPNAHTASDQSGLIWMAQLSQVQMIFLYFKYRWQFTCRWQGTRCSQLSPEFGSSPTPWLDSPCPNLTPPTSMAMSQIVSRLSKTSSSKNFHFSEDLGYHPPHNCLEKSNLLRLYKLLFSLSQIFPASILGPVFVTNKILWS